MPDYGPVPAAAILAHIKGITIDGFSVVWDRSGDTPERHMIFGDRLEDAAFTGLTGGALGKLEAVQVMNSKGVVVEVSLIESFQFPWCLGGAIGPIFNRQRTVSLPLKPSACGGA